MLNIKIDSRKVKKGDTFVALKGENVDGHDFINDAIKNGATKIVLSKDRDLKVEKILVKDTEEYLRNYLKKHFQKEINKIKLIGITGTNGKTTSCYLIYQMLKNLGKKVAYIGTIGYYYEDKKISLPNTTPNILDLYDLILESISKGCQYLVMEVSSHALAKKRIYGLQFDVVGFTNLTEDHLDYHINMDNYLKAKLQIISYLKEEGMLIVNADDAYSKYFDFKRKQTISFNKGDYEIKKFTDKLDKTDLEFTYQQEKYQLTLQLKNKYNMFNYLMALACVHNLEIDIKDILASSLDIKAPKGRCEIIKVHNGLAVVDYAHTPDAVLNIITSFKENAQNIITIIGCGGDRDSKKRPIMGDIATKYSNYVIFTDDNPRTEDNKKIMNDIIKGVEKDNYEIIYDRKEAIKKGVSLINKDTILLVLGKGHEDYQIIGREKHHFDDMEIIKSFL